MSYSNKKLTNRDVERFIADWNGQKPVEPQVPEPLFVWPQLGLVGLFRYLFRLWRYERKMKATGWRTFHEEFLSWYQWVTSECRDLIGDRDEFKDPQLVQLMDYLNSVKSRLRDNTISQAEWNRRKAKASTT